MTIYTLRNNSGDVYDQTVIYEVYCKEKETIEDFVATFNKLNELYMQLTGRKYCDDLYSMQELEVKE